MSLLTWALGYIPFRAFGTKNKLLAAVNITCRCEVPFVIAIDDGDFTYKQVLKNSHNCLNLLEFLQVAFKCTRPNVIA